MNKDKEESPIYKEYIKDTMKELQIEIELLCLRF